MTHDGPERRRHRFSEGSGFGDPYTGFSFEVGVDDPFQVDPTDAHALADLLDPAHYRPDAVDLEALLDVGLSYLAIEEYEQAADTFGRVAWFATEDSREAMEAWTNRGVAHAQLGEYDEAAGAAREALRIDGGGRDESESRFPDLAAVAELNLAYALWESGDSSRPLAHAERAVELDPRLPEAWYDLGFYYDERGLWEFAVEALERARALGLRRADVDAELERAREGLAGLREPVPADLFEVPTSDPSAPEREAPTTEAAGRDSERLGA
ncbi:tetratricopeptide repeat protein [Salinirubellus salinus]|uniref:Tetratricopeptide repeat protein n=1 Tax=Salinirubellus salinus TaxID=1364945 RepID=A0A9E7R785_9EURY|nr:tetratricopeptide repeat protein [Salinirubellus salinus]UWM55958.1 tetratricopeptide repeat protein [Salinirubellus salinus]